MSGTPFETKKPKVKVVSANPPLPDEPAQGQERTRRSRRGRARAETILTGDTGNSSVRQQTLLGGPAPQ